MGRGSPVTVAGAAADLIWQIAPHSRFNQPYGRTSSDSEAYSACRPSSSIAPETQETRPHFLQNRGRRLLFPSVATLVKPKIHRVASRKSAVAVKLALQRCWGPADVKRGSCAS